MKDTTFKTRFCPSPTGNMHLGNARTALFSALLAASKPNGSFLLRIEDTDLARSTEEFTQGLFEDLKWLGLNWQEGPYYQSKRQEIYDQYYHELEAQQLIYPCFCSQEDLEITRKLQLSAGKPPRYPGTCRKLTKDEVEKKIASGLTPTFRFHVRDAQLIKFDDMVKGHQRINGVDIGDFIIKRSDGTSPFMFVNAIDDALMGVTHVLRGEDHLTNTPRQILILEALKLPLPHYGHISLIVGSDGSKLSKRHGARSIRELREEGYLPQAIVNYLARLGHNYEDEHFMSFKELAEKFDVKNCGRASAKYDPKQLERWQHESVLKLSVEEMKAWIGEEKINAVPAEKRELFWQTIHANITFPSDFVQWAKILFEPHKELDEEQEKILKETNGEFFTTARKIVEASGDDYNSLKNGLQNQLGVKGKQLFQPLRIALTGQLHGPELENIMRLLGKEEIVRRFSKY